MTKLIIQRGAQYADFFRRYRILLDGREIGEIGRGQVIEQSIPEGEHSLQLKIDWCGSAIQRFTSSGEDISFTASSTLQGWKVFRVFYIALFDRDAYLRLERTR